MVGTVYIVLDLVGGEFVGRSYNVLKQGGRYVATAAMPPPDAGKDRGICATGTFTQPTAEGLTELAEAIDAGKVKVFLNHTFPIEESQTALFYKPEGGAPGKVVITID